jgi:GMP synthase (glutamine-hydrolysing)
MRPLYVINNYGQFNHLILRMLRDLDMDARMVPNTTPPETVSDECRGVILGGGPDIARQGNCPGYLDTGLPVLGICLGHHIIATASGGVVSKGKLGGYGAVEVMVHEEDDILQGYPKTIPVWASHADEVTTLPPGFTTLASSEICAIEAMADSKRRLYGLQWHPEVSHSVDGSRVYRNFDRICRDDR